ncbi:MAG: hypothetical protein HOM21_12000 [Halobacteriovoraceae bacterium]|nr:hypothetical protein [Halobacteriovoraceae bacterium]
MKFLPFFFILILNLSSCPNEGGTKGKGNSSGYAGTHSVTKQEKDLTQKGYEESFNLESGVCLNHYTGGNLVIDSLASEMQKLDGEVNCQSKCPFNYSILARDENPFNILAFTNSRASFSQNIGNGVCDGFVQVMEGFNHLAFWDKTKTSTLTENECGNKKAGEMSEKCLTMYKTKIMQITKGYQAVDIPGFSNLYEFSSHPSIQEILKAEIVRKHDVEFDPYTYDPALLSKDLKNNKTPLLMINNASHALMAYKSQIKDGVEIFCVRDPNTIPKGLFSDYKVETCKDYISKGARGWERVTNGAHSRIRNIQSSKSDQQRHHRYVEGVQKYCMARCQQLLPK